MADDPKKMGSRRVDRNFLEHAFTPGFRRRQAATVADIIAPGQHDMLGGGQLGRFFVSAAHELGYQVWVLDPDKNSPAGQIAERHFCVDYADYAALDEFAAGCAAITTEFENVPAATLDYLAKFVPVRPGAAAVAVCQHRVSEKSFLRDHGFPHGPFIAVNSENDLKTAPDALFPAILKVARFGYDGKGQATVNNREEALIAFAQFQGEQCVLEQRLTLDYEVSVVLARDAQGAVRCFPTGENQHTRGILDVSIVPARTTGCMKSDAEDIAARIAEKLGTLFYRFISENFIDYIGSPWQCGRTRHPHHRRALNVCLSVFEDAFWPLTSDGLVRYATADI